MPETRTPYTLTLHSPATTSASSSVATYHWPLHLTVRERGREGGREGEGGSKLKQRSQEGREKGRERERGGKKVMLIIIISPAVLANDFHVFILHLISLLYI